MTTRRVNLLLIEPLSMVPTFIQSLIDLQQISNEHTGILNKKDYFLVFNKTTSNHVQFFFEKKGDFRPGERDENGVLVDSTMNQKNKPTHRAYISIHSNGFVTYMSANYGPKISTVLNFLNFCFGQTRYADGVSLAFASSIDQLNDIHENTIIEAFTIKVNRNTTNTLATMGLNSQNITEFTIEAKTTSDRLGDVCRQFQSIGRILEFKVKPKGQRATRDLFEIHTSKEVALDTDIANKIDDADAFTKMTTAYHDLTQGKQYNDFARISTPFETLFSADE